MEHRRKQNKKKNFTIIAIASLLIIFIFALTFLIFFNQKKDTSLKSLGITINDNNYFLEIAQTTQEKKKGLSDRNELCSNCGMLFIFDKEDQHDFWMKDTHFPLDIIWLNSKKEIVKIITAAASDSETIYSNKTPAKYAIELPANESLKLNLQIGDIIPILDNE